MGDSVERNLLTHRANTLIIVTIKNTVNSAYKNALTYEITKNYLTEERLLNIIFL